MKHIGSIVFTIFTLTLLCGCSKAPINGDLDAQWQVMSVDYLDGTSYNPDGQLYICINLHTLQLWGPTVCTANMVYNSDAETLSYEFPLASEEELYPWGFGAPTATATIVRLNRKELVLLTDVAQITSRRF